MNLASDLLKLFKRNIQTYAIILALIFIWIIFAIATKGAYLGPQNFSNLFRQMTVTAFLAIGMVLIIVTMGIDLSVGKLAGFVSVVVAYLQANVWTRVIPDQPLLAAALSIFIGLAFGVLFECLQGWIIAYKGVPAFITTLGGLFILRGAILLVTQGKTIPANQPYLSTIAQGYLPNLAGWVIGLLVVAFLYFNMFNSRKKKAEYGFELPSMALDLFITTFFSLLVLAYIFMVNKYNGVQVPVLLLAIATAVMAYLTNNTRFGRYAYAMGGNFEAARLSGINTRKMLFLIFVLMGLLSGIAGVVLASYVGYGTIAAGEGYELDAIASAILGGTSTLGGVGTIPGAIIGALIMSSLSNGLQILNVAASWQYLLKGVVLVVAVYADVTLKKNR